MDTNTIQALQEELKTEKQYSADLEKHLIATHSKMEKLQRENSLIGKSIIALTIGILFALLFIK